MEIAAEKISDHEVIPTTSHPKGLYVLFTTEMWERFNYYGMRAILFLFMTKALLFADERASGVYGMFTSLVYLTPLLGGFLCDRFLGNRRSIFIGGIMMAIGQFMLYAAAAGVDVTSVIRNGQEFYSAAPGGQTLPIFYIGLGFIIFGNGFFKPNISSMVGQIYPPNDRRLDSAFTIFYMGINLGAFLGNVICSSVGDTPNPANFKWGFLAAGIAMVISTITFYFLKNKYLRTPTGEPVGLPPAQNKVSNANAVSLDAENQPAKKAPLTKEELDRIIVIAIISIFVIFFWAAFEQAGASLTLFADRNVDRRLFGTVIPASIFQSINAVAIVILAPILAWIWTMLQKRNAEPTSPAKQAIGLLLLALGYIVIALGVNGVDANTKVNMIWLVGMYLLHTVGELALSPIGLSMVVKLSPTWLVSFMMGVWFLSTSAANYFAGELSKLYPGKEFKLIVDKDGNPVSGNASTTLNYTEALKLVQYKYPNTTVLPSGAVTEEGTQLMTEEKVPQPVTIQKVMQAFYPSYKPIENPSSFIDSTGKALPLPLISSDEIEDLKKTDATVAAKGEVMYIKYVEKQFLGYKIKNLFDFFMLFAVMGGAASVILFASTRALVRMMHGRA